MSRRTETAYKAWSPGESAGLPFRVQHDRAQDSGDRVNTAYRSLPLVAYRSLPLVAYLCSESSRFYPGISALHVLSIFCNKSRLGPYLESKVQAAPVVADGGETRTMGSTCKSYTVAVDTDLSKFFDKVNHDIP